MKSRSHNPAMFSRQEAMRTLNPSYMTPYHKQAQWAEFCELKKVIGEIFNKRKQPLRVFDIGIGTARIPVWLSTVATWDKIAKYIGIEISPLCIAQSKRIATTRRIADKVEVIKFDAVNLSIDSNEPFKRDKYDLIVCTYFTAGNFKPGEIQLKTGRNGKIADYDVNLLRPNESFVAVIKGAFDMLKNDGKIVLGSVYRDNDMALSIQEQFYAACKMTVITSPKDPFTATKEGFWSERFNKEKIHDYLSWIPHDQIELIPLDDYDLAIMIVISK